MPNAPRPSARSGKPVGKWRQVAIIGPGLIGSSIGLALRRGKLAGAVIGVARSAATRRAAKRIGAVDAATAEIAEASADADLVVVCTPVQSIAACAIAAAHASRGGALITDAGSTKQQIVDQIERARAGDNWPANVRFVGSHPLAGGEKQGPEHASAELFAGRLVVVTPGPTDRAADVRQVRAFWKSLGARVQEMSPAEHDLALAATSHLPHLAAAAIAAATPKQYLGLCATGWRDITRVAAGDPDLWQQILLANSANLQRSLENLEAGLAAWRAAIAAGDAAKITEFLAKAKTIRDAVAS